MERRDDVDGSLANIEKALQVLTEQLPGKVRGSAAVWAGCASMCCFA